MSSRESRSASSRDSLTFHTAPDLNEEVERDLELLPAAQFDYSTNPKTLLNPGTVFEDIGVLGKGAFGEVRLVREATTGKSYALKYIADPNPEILQEEIGSLRDISGYPRCRKDIVCYYDAFQLKNGKIKYGILMEYIEGQTLDQYIRKNPNVSKNFLRNLALWLTTVLADLHAEGFTHRDIKPANIMISENNVPKLIDFGLACTNRASNGSAPSCADAPNGTGGYMPPDITTGSFANDRAGHLKAADVFAAGVTLYQAANRIYEPYKLVNELHVTGGIRPSTYDYPCFNTVVDKMINFDYKKRPTAAEANVMFQGC